MCPVDPPQLFDLVADPLALNILAEHADFAAVRAQLQAEVDVRWNAERLSDEGLHSERRHHWIQAQSSSGDYPAWDTSPLSMPASSSRAAAANPARPWSNACHAFPSSRPNRRNVPA